MMNKFGLIGLLSMSVLLVGCGNSHKATKSNFTKAIDEYAAHKKVCLPIDLKLQNNQISTTVFLGNQEIRIAKRDANDNDNDINKDALKQMYILVDAGLYQKEEIEELSGNTKIPAVIFKRTPDSKTAVLNSPTAPLLCVGEQQVEKVILFTEPMADKGLLMSKVVYDARLVPEKWVVKLFKIRSDGSEQWLHQPQRESTTLVLTNEGWKDQRAIEPD